MPGDPCDSNIVICLRSDDPANMRAMSVVISRIVIVINKIPASDIVDEPVAVIVYAVAGNFILIDLDIAVQIRMMPVGTGIDDTNHLG